MRKNSGSWFAAWSEDGETWYEVALTIVGGITPAYFGLYGLNYTNTGNARFSFPYLRYYANGTHIALVRLWMCWDDDATR